MESWNMADSNITKQALAAALCALMAEQPFEKINVAHICERCGMNRKSFYYHFRDKYDLVNWIFDTEFIALLKDERLGGNYDEHWSFVEKACRYFYEHHEFYRKALQIEGQNSFGDHFREYIRPLLAERVSFMLEPDEMDAFSMGFFTDTLICAVERWLMTKDCMPPEVFVEKLRRLIEQCAVFIYNEISGPDR